MDNLGRPFITVDSVGYGTKYFRSYVVILKKGNKGKIVFTKRFGNAKKLSSWINAVQFLLYELERWYIIDSIEKWDRYRRGVINGSNIL